MVPRKGERVSRERREGVGEPASVSVRAALNYMMTAIHGTTAYKTVKGNRAGSGKVEVGARASPRRAKSVGRYHRIERTAPIFSYEHSARATTFDVALDLISISTTTRNGSRASSTSSNRYRNVKGSPGPTKSTTLTASDFTATNGGLGRIARSISAIDAAQFPCALAATPYIAGPMIPGNSSYCDGNFKCDSSTFSSFSHR